MSEKVKKRSIFGLGLFAFLTLALVFFHGSFPVRAQLLGPQTWAGTSSGTGTAQTIAIHNISALADILGVELRFLPNTPNTGSTTLAITLDSGSIAPVVIKKQTSAGLTNLVGSEFQTAQIVSVMYDGTQFECLTCQTVVPSGTEADFTGPSQNVPTGWLIANGQAVSRTTFAGLFNTYNTTVTATTVNLSTSITVPNSAIFQVGWSVSANANVNCNATIQTIPDGTHITISAAATGGGSVNLTVGPYSQGDCSTTFNLPNHIGRTTAMVDGSTNITGAFCTNAGSLGATCGAQGSTLVTGNLPPYTPSGSITVGSSTLVASGLAANVGTASSGNPQYGNSSSGASATFTGNPQGGTSTAFTNLMPLALTYKIVKT